MPPTEPSDDEQLLSAWIRGRDQAAFRALAEKYSRLVYGAALRKTGRADWAEEITQEVFIVFARRAAGLRGSGGLAGWLHRTAVFTAATRLRAELRRDARMKKLAALSADNDLGLPSGTVSGKDWTALRPVLDDAIAALPPADRRVILLHYFEERTFAEVAALEGLTREAAKKRGLRALEKLALLLRRRGVSLPSGALCGGLTAAFSEAAPAALAAKAAAAGMTVTATTVVPLTAYLTGSLMTLKTSAVAASLVVCTAGLTWVAWPGQPGRPVPVAGLASGAKTESLMPDKTNRQTVIRTNTGRAGILAMPPMTVLSNLPDKALNEVFTRHPRTATANARIDVMKKGVKRILDLQASTYRALISRYNDLIKLSRDSSRSAVDRSAAETELVTLMNQAKEMEAEIQTRREQVETWLQKEAAIDRESILAEIREAGGVIPPQPEITPPVPDARIDPHFAEADGLMAGENYSGAYTAFAALAKNSSGNICDQANWNAMLCAMIAGNSEAAAEASQPLLHGTPSTACFALAATAIQENAWDEAQIWVDQASESGNPAENAAMGKVLGRLGWMEEGTNRLIPPDQ